MSFINKMMDEINQGRQQQTTNKASDVGQQSLNEIFGEKAAPDTLGQFQQMMRNQSGKYFQGQYSPPTGSAQDLFLPLPPPGMDEINVSPETDPITGMPFNELTGTPDSPAPWIRDTMEEQRTGVPQDPTLRGTGQPGELYGAPMHPSDPNFHKEMQEEMQREKKDSNVETLNKESINGYFKGINWKMLLQEMFKR